MNVFIGLDIGTTSTKAVAFDEAGDLRGEHAVAYPLLSESSGWAEQEPHDIFDAVLTSMRETVKQVKASGGTVAGVGISTAMHALLALDEHDNPLTRLIVWADNRSAEQAKRLSQSETGYLIYRRTGTPIHAMSPLAKLVWLRENRLDLFTRTSKFMSLKDYVAYRLFGQYVMDYSIASATGLFNLERLDWDDEALSVAGVERTKLPALKPTTYILTDLNDSHASAMGLRRDTPFVLGASDGVLANLGVGAIDEGELAVTIGTSGAVRTVIGRPVTDELQRTFCYALTDRRWVVGGANNNGAIVLQWLRGALSGGGTAEGIESLLSRAEEIEAGSEGLLFLPFLSGERAPIWNANARGVLFGLSLAHTQAHMVRAAIEGMLFSIRSIVQAIEDTGVVSDRVLISGGFVKSAFLQQMLADVLGKTVLVPNCYEASAFGAAVLAMHALGALTDLADVKQMVAIKESLRPNSGQSAVYTELMGLYRKLYEDLKQNFDLMAEFQTRKA